MRTLAAIVLLLFTSPARGKILFIDLNNSTGEMKACTEGVKAANADDEVLIVGPSGGSERMLDGDKIVTKVKEFESAGHTFDSIVVSGEDGSGHFFGSHGEFFANEFRALVKSMNSHGLKIETTALWGCYPTTKHGCETYWLKPNRSINMAVGFALQGPKNTRPENFQLLKEFCQKRAEAVRALTLDQMCHFYENLNKGVLENAVGICNREGLAAKAYSDGKARRSPCLSYQELQARCRRFEPSPELEATFAGCMSGEIQDYENHCTDSPQKQSALRRYYGQVNLWLHCREQVNGRRKAFGGYQMPLPAKTLRLLKFGHVRDNLARLNKKELQDYDNYLAARGLGEFVLDDISKLSRAELNHRIEGAIRALRHAGSDSALLRMAEGLGKTFVALEPTCSHYMTINKRRGEPSDYILSYKQASESAEEEEE